MTNKNRHDGSSAHRRLGLQRCDGQSSEEDFLLLVVTRTSPDMILLKRNILTDPEWTTTPERDGAHKKSWNVAGTSKKKRETWNENAGKLSTRVAD